MKQHLMRGVIIVLATVILLGALVTTSCSTGVSQEDYERATGDLVAAQSKVEKLQSDYDSLNESAGQAAAYLEFLWAFIERDGKAESLLDELNDAEITRLVETGMIFTVAAESDEEFLARNSVFIEELTVYIIYKVIELLGAEAPLGASPAKEIPQTEKRPSIDPIAEETAEFWAAARPIVEQQVAEFGRPLAELTVELGPQMASGQPTAYSQWIGELQERRQYLARAFLQFSELEPPPGIAARWHQAQLKAWGMRLDALDIVVANWDFHRHLFVGSEEDAQLGDELWQGAMLTGQRADRLQGELIQWLAERLRQ
ncbi:hypothetical protein M1O19_00220 [Dehalococcoidia bacterium]|nr:hypothetical protein [Dehalococcoidia bacterium]